MKRITRPRAIARVVFYLMLALFAVAIFYSRARGDEPPPVKGFAHLTEPEPPPVKGFVREREQWRAPDGLLYERHDDGVYRLVPGRAASGVAAPQTFRTGAYHAGHDCPACGHQSPARTGTWIVRGHNSDGTHTHSCPNCGASWRH